MNKITKNNIDNTEEMKDKNITSNDILSSKNDLIELNKFMSGDIKFVYGSDKVSRLPEIHLPQISFIGKSNVGKSSLINFLTNRKSLARTSHTPGRTQQINFFSVRDSIFITDLPGYGYAKVSKDQHKTWENLILFYLENSANLYLSLVLVDSRRGIKDNDLAVMNLLENFQKKYWIIFTKSDKISQKERENLILQFENLKKINNIKAEKYIFTNTRSEKDAQEFKINFWNFIKNSRNN